VVLLRGHKQHPVFNPSDPVLNPSVSDSTVLIQYCYKQAIPRRVKCRKEILTWS
jgi:hypothetical protein